MLYHNPEATIQVILSRFSGTSSLNAFVNGCTPEIFSWERSSLEIGYSTLLQSFLGHRNFLEEVLCCRHSIQNESDAKMFCVQSNMQYIIIVKYLKLQVCNMPTFAYRVDQCWGCIILANIRQMRVLERHGKYDKMWLLHVHWILWFWSFWWDRSRVAHRISPCIIYRQNWWGELGMSCSSRWWTPTS